MNMHKVFNHGFIFATIFFTVYSQLIMRWQVSLAGPLPADFCSKIKFIIVLLLNPWVVSAIAATLCAGVSWMLVMAKFELSYAFPFNGITYVSVLVAGFLIFNESMSASKIVGSLVVIIGVVIIARG
jgi:multidrug transporter EmrE-like cation transporter